MEILYKSNAPFLDRKDAGQHLAGALGNFRHEKPVVLALPRGGVPVAFEVAKSLNAPLDLLFVRKIGCPGHEEFGIGAVVDLGFGQEPTLLINEEICNMLKTPAIILYIQKETERQLQEIKRQRAAYLRKRQPIQLKDRVAIVVDDGIATGGTARTALKALKQTGVKRAVLAVPVSPRDSLEDLKAEGNEVVCLNTPANFRAVGLHYKQFPQTSDSEVIKCMDDSLKYVKN